MTRYDCADPAEQLAAVYGLSGAAEHVQMGRRVHIVQVGEHRTLCGKLVDKAKTDAGWVERDRYTWGRATCGTCQKAAYKATKAALDRTYGPVATYERGGQ